MSAVITACTGCAALDKAQPAFLGSYYYRLPIESQNKTLTSRTEKQISSVIKSLTEGSPADQENALDTYFLPDSSFIHPLCRVPSFKNYAVPLIGEINSRWVIWMIYRWYKILSPRIVLDVECDGTALLSNLVAAFTDLPS